MILKLALSPNGANETERSSIDEVKTELLLLPDVAAHLRSLRADDPSSKGHPRPIKQKLELCQYQTYFRNY